MKTRNCYKIIEVTPFGETYSIPMGGFIWGNELNDICLERGERYIVSPKGTYFDTEVDVFIVELIQESDPTNIINFVNIGEAHPDLIDGLVPVHLTTRADNVHALEGGIRAAINGYDLWADDDEPIAIVEYCNIVQTYEYVSPPLPAC